MTYQKAITRSDPIVDEMQTGYGMNVTLKR